MNKKKLMFIHPGPLFPPIGGGSARTLSFISFFRSKDYQIQLITRNHGKYNDELEKLVDEFWIYNKQTVQQIPSDVQKQTSPSFLQRARNERLINFSHEMIGTTKPDAIICSYAWNADTLIKCSPKTLKIIDTIDVQHLRTSVAKKSGGDLSSRYCSREEEINELQKADLLIAIRYQDKKIFQELCPDKKVAYIPHTVDRLQKLPAHENSKIILFVGNLYDPNIRGIRSFLEVAWPQIIEKVPDARFYVCGKICEAVKDEIEGVELKHVVPEIISYYKKAAVVLNLVPYCTGLPIKTVEALSYGKCLVTTKAGVISFEDNRDLPAVICDYDEMAEAIISLLTNPSKRMKIENRAFEYASKYLNIEFCCQRLENMISQYVVTSL